MEKKPTDSDPKESRAHPSDQHHYDTDDFMAEARNITPLAWPEDQNVKTKLAVFERLDFFDESVLSKKQIYCPCSYPWRRFIAENHALHFLIPIVGCIIDRHPANCSLHAPPSQTSTWVPPRWLKARSVQCGFSWSAESKPRITLKTTRCLPDNAECFEAAKVGDIDRVKDLLASGQCGVGDIAVSTGYTMLLWAVRKRQSRMINFLTDSGADPFHDFVGFQPAPCHLAWDLWLRGLIPRDDSLMMRPMLGRSNYVDYLNLPVLHQIILKLSLRSFKDELLANPSAVHSKDFLKRTALSWAAASGSRICVARLLGTGADPNIPDKHNKTPLYLAVEYEMEYTFDTVDALLNAGAETDPTLPHPKRSTPLLCAASNVKDLRVLHRLLCAGANVNAKNRYGKTPLHVVAQNKPAVHTALLLSFGASMFVKDQHGKTAVDIAIKHDNVDVLHLLKTEFHHLRSSKLAPNISRANAYIQRPVAHWDSKGLPQFFPVPETDSKRSGSIDFTKINSASLKKVKKQLCHYFSLRPDLTSPEVLEKLDYCYDAESKGDLDSIDESVQDVEKIMPHDMIE